MKIPFSVFLLLLTATIALAAGDDLTTTLQKGLFEEEANHDLPEAIKAYESVVAQIDKDRKLAATAIFRLGECYRKQGKTNEANAYYERILRDFADQPNLAALSKKSLSGSGEAPATPPSNSAGAKQEFTALNSEIEQLRELPKEQLRVAIQQRYPNPVLSSLMQQWVTTEQELRTLTLDYGPEHPEVKKATARKDSVSKQIDEQVEVALMNLESKRDALTAALKMSVDLAAALDPDNSSETRRIQNLIKNSPDLINAPQKDGLTLLESAAAKGDIAVISLLLENGAVVDGLKQPGFTPLHYAAANGHKAAVELLIRKKAKVDAALGGITALHVAVLKGYEGVAAVLQSAGIPVNSRTTQSGSYHIGEVGVSIPVVGQTPLHLASAAGYQRVVDLLIERGADVNAVDDAQRTPLSYAVEAQSAAVVDRLLKATANPNAGGANLPLFLAVYRGDLPMITTLLQAGADANTNCPVTFSLQSRRTGYYQGCTCNPMAVAVYAKKPAAVTELIHFKADPNALGPDGWPLLYEALQDLGVLEALVKGGTDPNKQGRAEVSPLFQAVYDKNPAAVELLLAHGAEVAAVNRDGYTALHHAVQRGDERSVELLLAKGAEVNAKAPKDGMTPLHFAAVLKLPDIAQRLLAAKADPNVVDSSGRTPLDWTKESRLPSARPPSVPLPPVAAGQPVPAPAPFGVRVLESPGASPADGVAELLRKHGAIQDMPRLDRIQLRRASSGYALNLNAAQTNAWARFTLVEMLGMAYELLAVPPAGQSRENMYDYLGRTTAAQLGFPNLARIQVRRPSEDVKSWRDMVFDLTPLMLAGDCSQDVDLRAGDVIELPERDHPINEPWRGFSKSELEHLRKCLAREVELVIKGQKTKVVLQPEINLGDAGRPLILTRAPFWLKPVVRGSPLVLASSDLSRVKVTRIDPSSGKNIETVVNCTDVAPAPEVFLRNGDVIEIPEKP